MKRPAVTLLALALSAVPALAQDTTPPPAQTTMNAPATSLATDVVLVRIAGPWQMDGQQGFSRFVARAAGATLSLSVEWISDAGAVVQAMPLDAPPGVEQLPLARIHGESGELDSAVYFDTPENAQGFRETFVLIVGEPGNARFGPATN